jgi:hypothetical protein
MADLLAYTAPLMMVGALTALLLPNEAAAVVAAQAAFLALELIGGALSALLARNSEET